MKYSKLANEFEQLSGFKLFEIAMVNDNYLLVDLSIATRKGKSNSVYPIGLYFDFDQRSPDSPYNDLPVFFDGKIKKLSSGNYLYPFDDCFSLDEHLQEIYANVVEGFLVPNNLYKFEE